MILLGKRSKMSMDERSNGNVDRHAGGDPTRRAPRQRVAVLFLGAALAGGAPGFAVAQSQSGTPGGWQFEVTPYLWVAGIKADVQARDLPQTSADVSFSELLNHLDMAAMGAFEARKDRWGFLFDGLYMKLSDSGTSTNTGPGPAGAASSVDADVTIKASILSGAVAYRVLEGSTPVDLIGGARYVKLDVDADIGAALFGPVAPGVAATVSRSGSKSWTDPFLGVRVLHPIADRWALMGYADSSGGGGSSSTWQAAAGASYDYSKDVSVKFGYRYLKLDYDQDTAHIDMKMSGPYIGVGIRF